MSPSEPSAKICVSSDRPSRSLLFAVGLVYLATTGAFLSWQLRSTGQQLRRWERISYETDLALPLLSHNVLVASAHGTVGSGALIAWGLVGAVTLMWSARTPRRMAVWAAAFALAVAVATVVMASSVNCLDRWLGQIGDVRPPLTVARFSAELDGCGAAGATPDEIRQAGLVMRLISLKHAVGLLRIDESQIDRLISIARDPDRSAEAKFVAAFALMPIDHDSPEACAAIRDGISAARKSGDERLRGQAENFLDHPCLRDLGGNPDAG